MQKNIAEREADITYQANHDPFTGLPNRAFVEKKLEEIVAGSDSTAPVALVLIDMRNVSEINASLGAVGNLSGPPSFIRPRDQRLGIAPNRSLRKPGAHPCDS
jgi:predicted signal transduction protein with EAL and GGDEF domain